MMINRKINCWILNWILPLLAIAWWSQGCVVQRPLPQANHENRGLHTSATKLHARAAAFLLTRQNPDGSFGEPQKKQMLVAKTALILYSLAVTGSADTPANKALTSARQKALTWFLAHQNQDGSFGFTHERIFATIMGIKALLEVSPQKHNRAIRRARAFLRAQHGYFAHIAQNSPMADLASCKMAWTKAKIPTGRLARIYMDTVLPAIASMRHGWQDSTLKSLAQYQQSSKGKNERHGFTTTKGNPLESDPAVCAALVVRSAAMISLSLQKGWQCPANDTRIQELNE